MLYLIKRVNTNGCFWAEVVKAETLKTLVEICPRTFTAYRLVPDQEPVKLYWHGNGRGTYLGNMEGVPEYI